MDSNAVSFSGSMLKFPDTSEKYSGDTSLRLKPILDGTVSEFSIELRNASSGSPFSFMIKGDANAVGLKAYLSDYYGRERLIELSDDWSSLEGITRARTTTVRFENPEGVDFTVWIDDLKPDDRVEIQRSPYHHATFLGQEITLDVEAATLHPLSYQWRKNGIPIEEATGPELHLGPIRRSDLGDYDVVCANAFHSATSNAASITLAPDLGAALGQTGLRVSTYGESLWELDENMSREGETSLTSGHVGPGGVSVLNLWLGEGTFASYYLRRRLDSREGELPASDWGLARAAAEDGVVQLRLEGVIGTRLHPWPTKLWIDELEMIHASLFSFEKWARDWREAVPSMASDGLARYADVDGDGLSTLAEFALGTHPFEVDDHPRFALNESPEGISLELEYNEVASGDVRVAIELSQDLRQWFSAETFKSYEPSDAKPNYRRARIALGLEEWDFDESQEIYYRVRIVDGIAGDEFSTGFSSLRRK